MEGEVPQAFRQGALIVLLIAPDRLDLLPDIEGRYARIHLSLHLQVHCFRKGIDLDDNTQAILKKTRQNKRG